ncbi:MAG: DnaJ-class molecular chaperone [Bradymonadia bacterium]|jgi:DnaJ-class molecular chaperone
MSRSSYYDILGLRKDASAEQVKDAYRDVARKEHPDRNPGDYEALDRFKAASEAYRVLGDPAQRANYDTYGVMPVGASYGAPHALVRIDGLQRLARGLVRAARALVPIPGDDVRQTIDLSLAEAAVGTTRVFELHRRSPSGALEERRLEFTIPPGVRDRQVLRWKGEGAPGTERAASGDLIVDVRVQRHPSWRRRRNDIHETRILPLVVFFDGATLEVETVRGSALLEVSPGTHPGMALRIAGEGVGTTPPGDHVVIVEIRVDDELTDEARALLHAFENTRSGIVMPEEEE